MELLELKLENIFGYMFVCLRECEGKGRFGALGIGLCIGSFFSCLFCVLLVNFYIL